MVPFDSPYSPYLNQNHMIQGLQRNQLKELLGKPQGKLSDLNAAIGRLDESLQSKMRERDALATQLSKHHRILAPIRKLSDEILRLIFIWCLPTKHNAIMSTLECPLLLTHVCGHWRRVALGFPWLWARLHIPIPSSSEIYNCFGAGGQLRLGSKSLLKSFNAKVDMQCNMIHEWLKRSGTCPLSLSLLSFDSMDNYVILELEPFINTTFQYCDRWFHLELGIPDGSLLDRFANIPAEKLPMLSRLSLKFVDERGSRGREWTNAGLLKAPHLNTLILSHFSLPCSSIEADWSGLTHFSLAQDKPFYDLPVIDDERPKFSPDEVEALFRRCPRLIYCSIEVYDKELTTIYHSSEPISLPCLETLTVIDGSRHMANLFRTLITPNLRHVSYYPEPDLSFSIPVIFPNSAPAGNAPLVHILEGFGEQVTELSVDLHSFTRSELIKCLQLVPELTAFRHYRRDFMLPRSFDTGLVIPISVADAFLDILASPFSFHRDLNPNSASTSTSSSTMHTRTFLCPKLKILGIRHTFSVSDTSVASFIHSRMAWSRSGTCTKLQYVDVGLTHVMFKDVRPALLPYREEGMSLRLDYIPLPPATNNPFSSRNGFRGDKYGRARSHTAPWFGYGT